MKHRKEEDDLYRKFARQRDEEEKRMRDEFRDEWEKELERLTTRFEREMSTRRGRRPDEQRVLTLRHQQERETLERSMTLRRDKKKESLTRKLLEHESYSTKWDH
ncbi:Hillarin [Gryllus bimaculatus]|nr:Hillarin [Gryllus bimaculatus]